MIEDPTGNIDGWQIIKARTTIRNDDGGKTLRMFFDALKIIDLKDFLSREIFWSAVSRENWQMDPTDWKIQYKATY